MADVKIKMLTLVKSERTIKLSAVLIGNMSKFLARPLEKKVVEVPEVQRGDAVQLFFS